MHIKLLRQFGQRLFPLDRRQRHLRLEGRSVVPTQGRLVLPNSGHFENEADVQRGAPTGVLDVFAS
jgi:hypothetical protein